MNKSVLIFCEGVTDQIFIADCLEIFYSFTLRRTEINVKRPNIKGNSISENKIEIEFERGKIFDVGGCDNLSYQTYLDKLRDSDEEGNINLVLFDADEIGRGNNSFSNAHRSLEDMKKNHKINFDFYLWPNHNEDGEVENLIRKLIHPRRECIMDCIESHQECLRSTSCDNLRLADKKQLIQFYIYTNSIDKTTGRHVDYKDSALWNLTPSEVPDLQKLKNFLDQYFL